MPKSTTIIAFDHHAAPTVGAVLLPGQRTSTLHSLTSDSPTILRFVERLRRTGPVQCCDEAGPCGFELQRALTARDLVCDVKVNPRDFCAIDDSGLESALSERGSSRRIMLQGCP